MTDVLYLLIACIMMLVPALGLLGYLLKQFYFLRDRLYVHVSTAREFLEIIENIEALERPEEQLARLSKLSPKEIQTEMEKSGLMGVLKGTAKELLRSMRADLPDLGR